MSQPGAKTPVSILHEFFISIGKVPTYELIDSTFGGHVNNFVYRVCAGEYSSIGDGPSKQIAKHRAAQKLLDVLLQEKSFNQANLQAATKVLSSPQDNVISFNAVGDLSSYCEEKSHPAPVYEQIQETGPPHARQFAFKCSVSNLSEIGASRTKKQAKHQAAYAMLVRLKSLCGDEYNAIVTVDTSKKEKEKAAAHFSKKDEEASTLYHKLSRRPRAQEATVYIADQYRAYSLLVEKCPTLCKLIAKEMEDEVNPMTCLEEIAKELNIKVEYMSQAGGLSAAHFVRLNVCPVLIKGGKTRFEAAEKAIERLVSLAS